MIKKISASERVVYDSEKFSAFCSDAGWRPVITIANQDKKATNESTTPSA